MTKSGNDACSQITERVNSITSAAKACFNFVSLLDQQKYKQLDERITTLVDDIFCSRLTRHEQTLFTVV
ncbi:hypothetical protein T10_1266 [Trichinella papuae]|uniref:Uncharacterized protein n=1 Tax=Trichinella papuae TaxID=268474 RepID=A0A0V1MVY2_9BILA|nr:hypothetical protein T10_1266 [Trichinella papuae]